MHRGTEAAGAPEERLGAAVGPAAGDVDEVDAGDVGEVFEDAVWPEGVVLPEDGS